VSDLLELAARCEAADGEDRLLDAEIYVALDAERENLDALAINGAVGTWVPKCTASLDAAMTLVPEENDSWSLMKWPQDGKPTFRATVSWTVKSSHKNASGPYVMHKPHVRRAEAATPALALCAAALRARAS
jgi:hypothetical protein